MSEQRLGYKGMIPCHKCGEPAVPSWANHDDPLPDDVVIWCRDCALIAEAEAITKEATDA